mmetsp:Transcript_7296/g.21564  ORF Transcript_7296/g.21564 Transcript_7296/m.21564 type:complete len:86 (+) Transcript_7296:98-355(+)
MPFPSCYLLRLDLRNGESSHCWQGPALASATFLGCRLVSIASLGTTSVCAIQMIPKVLPKWEFAEHPQSTNTWNFVSSVKTGSRS